MMGRECYEVDKISSGVPYEQAQRLMGFFCDDPNIISDHSIENIAMRCGEDLRNI